MGSTEHGVPAEFVIAVAEQAEPGTAAVAFAAGQAELLPEGSVRERVLSALLGGAFRDSAPGWVVEAAVSQGLSDKNEHWPGSGVDLAATALAHPDCPAVLREAALRECTDVQLAHLATEHQPMILTTAVAVELRRRSPRPTPMTRELLKQPGPARKMLRTGELADAVFDAAFELLPTEPDRGARPDLEFEEWNDWIVDQFAAWESMWTSVLEAHPKRHALIVKRTEGGPAGLRIRHILIGVMPWTVEPSLLNELAMADLAEFQTAALVTEICRALRDGASKESVRECFAKQIDALSARGLKHVNVYLDQELLEPESGCNAAADWSSGAAEGRWRLLLNPADARPRYSQHHGEPYGWRTPETDLAELGRSFAATTLPALITWEPSDRFVSYPAMLRWVLALLSHLPRIDDEVKAAVRPVVDGARAFVRSATYSSARYEERRSLEELIVEVRGIVADPPPGTAWRRRALGDPAQVTFRELEGVDTDVLEEYLDRHAGDDALVEKALLAIASSSYGRESRFGEVLRRHSDPDKAVREITHDLRRRLGGVPAAREQWAREVLALPTCDSRLIRELPAWTALKLSGGHDRDHPEIAGAITAALGDDEAAWQRLAAGPATYAGPTAWLRLGEVLDAARSGEDWPSPPAR